MKGLAIDSCKYMFTQTINHTYFIYENMTQETQVMSVLFPSYRLQRYDKNIDKNCCCIKSWIWIIAEYG